MPKLSKKMIRAIEFTSVFDAVLRERHASTLDGYFADHPPEMWNDQQKEDFDLAAEVEYRMHEAILKLFGVESVDEGEK